MENIYTQEQTVEGRNIGTISVVP